MTEPLCSSPRIHWQILSGIHGRFCAMPFEANQVPAGVLGNVTRSDGKTLTTLGDDRAQVLTERSKRPSVVIRDSPSITSYSKDMHPPNMVSFSFRRPLRHSAPFGYNASMTNPIVLNSWAASSGVHFTGPFSAIALWRALY